MRLIVTYSLTLGCGTAINAAIASAIGAIYPPARIPAFAILSLALAVTGYRHARTLDMQNSPPRSRETHP